MFHRSLLPPWSVWWGTYSSLKLHIPKDSYLEIISKLWFCNKILCSPSSYIQVRAKDWNHSGSQQTPLNCTSVPCTHRQGTWLISPPTAHTIQLTVSFLSLRLLMIIHNLLPLTNTMKKAQSGQRGNNEIELYNWTMFQTMQRPKNWRIRTDNIAFWLSFC
jgi:hypothetical protein